MFDELVQKLRQCHQADYEVGQTFIRVLPSRANGFPVMIEWVWGAHFTVFLDGWHRDFDTYQEALRCFALAVSGHYRLKTQKKGGFRFRWTVEYWDGSDWVEDSTTTDLFYPFWKPTSTNYLRNDLHCGDATGTSRRELACCLVTASDVKRHSAKRVTAPLSSGQHYSDEALASAAMHKRLKTRGGLRALLQ